MATGEFGTYLRKVFPSLDFVPIAFTTAKDGRNVYTVLNLAQNLFKQASRRVGTGDLNRVLRRALDQQPPPPEAKSAAQDLLCNPGCHPSTDHRSLHEWTATA